MISTPIRAFASLTGVLLLAGCAATLVPGNPVEFELAVGERVDLSEQGAGVQFVGVTSDSRCPSDVFCVWAGDAAIALRLTGVPSTLDTTLHTTVDPNTVQIGALTLSVINLTPTPVSTTPTDPTKYRVRLRAATD